MPFNLEPFDPSTRADEPGEERFIYPALIAIGLIPAIIAIARGGVLGADATIGILMCAVGLVGLVRGTPRRRLPRSRAIKFSSRSTPASRTRGGVP